MKTSNGARKRYIALSLALVAPVLCVASALVNINTADEAALETLPGIGPSKAAAILEYRSEHGPFASIEDIQNVSGIGPSTYASLSGLITVGDAAAESTETASATSTPASSGGATTYVPPPTALAVSVPAQTSGYLDVPLALSATVTTGSGARDPNAALSWNFGDGSTNSGNPVEKTYRYPGTYAVTVTAKDGSTVGQAELTVSITRFAPRISAVSGEGITLANDSSNEIDISDWALRAGEGQFRLPAGTRLLASTTVLFPQSVTNLPVAFDARLLYPDGMLAAQYDPTPAAEVKPDELPARTNQVKGVDSVASVSLPAHEQPAVAPAAPLDTSPAAGAPFAANASADVADAPVASGLLHSVWTYGFLGVLTVAGGAFLIL